MFKNYKKILFAVSCAPNADYHGLKTFADLINYAGCIISSSVVPFIFALAVVVFIWGVVQYIMGAEEEAKREKGRQFMIWGIIALTVMVSIWGLVRIATNTFGVTYIIPKVQNTTIPQ